MSVGSLELAVCPHKLEATHACEADCARSRGVCAAFTYVTDAKVCYLKHPTPASSPCPTCRSGSRRGLEPNTDRPGYDFATATTASSEECAQRCAVDSRCQAFTWVPSTTTCYLKDVAASARSSAGMISGIRRGLEFNVDRPGKDYRSFLVSGPRPEVCQAACAQDSACQAWTLTTNPSATRETRCWLKSGVPAAISSWSMISGRKGAEFF